MKKKTFHQYLMILAVLFILLNLSGKSSEILSSATAAIVAPVWGKIHGTNRENQEILQLRLENQLLQNELTQLKELILFQEDNTVPIPARVIFRSPSSWNSSLWINLGRSNNDIIQKNCPVVVGKSVVGVVDYVGKKQSRVRLITDSGLTPSVRSVRDVHDKTWYLAKGELHGSSKPLWRTNSHVLKGIGFNYDFPDEQGPARDLRTGEPMEHNSDLPPLPIIQVDDLLVTTGMDGVFPPNLHVARVTRINLLKEGDYFYEIEAIPTVENLDDLSLVFMLQPIGYDPADQPPIIGRFH